ncbi:hypothetical protein SLA2020_158170 [Shorea laevis]
MADYGGGISLSQAQTSDDDSSEHSPRCVPTLATPGSAVATGSSKSKLPSQKLILTTLDHHQTPPSTSENVSSGRKPRGRPPGSKNKPKPPIVITRESDSAMKPAVLEISAGSDIIETIINFARRNHVGVCVISASGTVSNVTLRHPVSHAPALSLHGPFGLLSLSGTFMGSFSPTKPTQPSSTSSSTSCFGVTLAGAQGQVFGGTVGGKMMAATVVVVVAATFMNPAYHKLPCEGDKEEETKPCGGGASDQSCSTTGMSMSVYAVANPSPISCQISPDVMPWGSSSRPY